MSVRTRWVLVAITVIGLAIDAYTHFDLASLYAGNKTSTVSQETLFRIEAVLAILAALAVVVRPHVSSIAIALLVAGGGLALLVLYRYVDVGKVGPLPDMYEPVWYDEKAWSAVGEIIAVLGSLGLFLAPRFAAHGSRDAMTATA